MNQKSARKGKTERQVKFGRAAKPLPRSGQPNQSGNSGPGSSFPGCQAGFLVLQVGYTSRP